MIIYILDAKIIEITNLSPTVKGYKLAVKDGNDITFKAGQWVDFFIPTVGIVLDFFPCKIAGFLSARAFSEERLLIWLLSVCLFVSAIILI